MADGEAVRAWHAMRSGAAAPSGAKAARPRKDSGDGSARTAARDLDQFYTRGKFAARCLRLLARRYDLSRCLLIEPSAGGGAFYSRMPVNTVAFDVAPKCRGILKANYLTLIIRSERRIITIGNPPFGRVASLAVEFFNHSARHSDVIAMILPRSFLKASVENRLNCAFHRVFSKEVPRNSFELEGERRDVGTVFQIWERRGVPREMREEDDSHQDFEFTTPALSDFAIRRAGARAGDITRDRSNLHEKSYYFIKGDVEHVMRELDLAGAAANATSTPSLAKSEIVALYRKHVAKLATPKAARRPRPSPRRARA